MVCWLVAILLGRTVGDSPAARRPHADPAAVYRTETEHGFTLHVHPRLRDHPAEAAVMRAELAAQLAAIVRAVPAGPLAELRRVPIWLEWRLKPNGAAEYHRSADWLVGNGYNPAKAGGVEVANAVNFVRWSRGEQPWMLLHELAHAYHFRVLGDRHPGIEIAFQQAKDRRLYEAVGYVRGGQQRAYAVVNSGEYFAELTEAYFGRNDFFPYTRAELERHDPAGHALMAAVWGRPAAPPPPVPRHRE
jgi:hypothetical protein